MDKYQKFVDEIGKKYLTSGQLELDEPLSLHTTFKIGGPAKIFFKIKDVKELIKIIKLCQKLDLPYFILGGGSNVLVGDLGFKGVVVKNKTQEIRTLGYRGEVRRQKSRVRDVYIQADSGVLVNRLVRFTLDQGLEGLESFLGLPGTVGGAVYTNAHNLRTGDYFGDKVYTAQILTLEGKIKEVSRFYFKFGYDKSKIQQTKEVVISAIFKLKAGDKAVLWEKADRVMKYRQETQPWGRSSSGCIFKNIPKSVALRLSTPNYTQSAGYLIDQCGLKGYRLGKAKISRIHANFIVNLDGAKAGDVLKLIRLIKRRVKEKFAVVLEEEVEVVGEFKE